jgi:hypothetical protein
MLVAGSELARPGFDRAKVMAGLDVIPTRTSLWLIKQPHRYNLAVNLGSIIFG